MTRKTSMLAAASAVALALGAGTAANAQGFALGTGEWYAKAFGGATFPQDDDTSLRGAGADNQDFELKYNTGYTLGAALGAYFTPNISMELEYAYRRADLDDPVAGHTSSNAVMLNALYWFDGMGPNAAWQPYVGGGVGWTNIDVATNDFGDFKRDNAIGYQVIGGVAFDVSPAWTVMGEVRWFGTDSGDAEGRGGAHFDTRFDTVDLLVGAAYNF